MTDKIHPTLKEEIIENASEPQTETSETIVQTIENDEEKKVEAGIDSKTTSTKHNLDKVK